MIFPRRSTHIVWLMFSQLWVYLVSAESSYSVMTSSSVVNLPSLEDNSLDFTGVSPISENATCGDWASWLPPRTYPAVVMQVVSEDYVDLQRNFMRLMELNSVFTRHNMYLMCMDDASVNIFASMSIRCVPLGALPFATLHDVWRVRIRALSCLVTQGFDVIMSDADALWLRDPMEYFSLPSVRSSSVVASRGTLPMPLSKRWGTAMCMGFILFRATGPGMDKLQRSMEAFVAKNGDDQVAANKALDEFGVTWDEDSDMRLTESTALGRGTIEMLRSDDSPFVVTLLPHSVFTRQCSRVPISEDTVVAHCYARKNPGNGSRVAWMKKASLWLLNTTNP